ncbi:hypothetical protein N657DRAFT_389045 [Parathielavia appendiculata]|uniref:Uncharacterized protein n=1 Tax=Parathielavia appendiculata TaxID=2587402 RepID=A0AAN6Z4Y1_9PEZI|nr:hypothetical protein N657DRAFT_389045 [Parathielavia appendiculata]
MMRQRSGGTVQDDGTLRHSTWGCYSPLGQTDPPPPNDDVLGTYKHIPIHDNIHIYIERATAVGLQRRHERCSAWSWFGCLGLGFLIYQSPYCRFPQVVTTGSSPETRTWKEWEGDDIFWRRFLSIVILLFSFWLYSSFSCRPLFTFLPHPFVTCGLGFILLNIRRCLLAWLLEKRFWGGFPFVFLAVWQRVGFRDLLSPHLLSSSELKEKHAGDL